MEDIRIHGIVAAKQHAGGIMFSRKLKRDSDLDRKLPLPCQMISNEETTPIPQTEFEQRVERTILDDAAHYAKKLGIDRRTFLRTSGGMACAFLALNKLHGGNFYDVAEAEVFEQAATEERLPKGLFIIDSQNHFCQDGMKTNLRNQGFLRDIGAPEIGNTTDDYNFETFVREIFFDSDTTMGLVSGIPSRVDGQFWGQSHQRNLLPVDMAISARDQVNQMAGSHRMLGHGQVAPNHHASFAEVAEEMEREVRELKIDAWKHYTHNPLTTDPWRYDDEQVAYPFWEKSLELGMDVTCVHKGLADSSRNERFAHPEDIKQASLDFPEMNFLIYHSGMRRGVGGFNSSGTDVRAEAERLGGLEWTRDLCRDRDENPQMTNVYCEIGSVFAMCVGDPVLMGHLLGSIAKSFGTDHIIWGTDCLWWGSPQWIIQAMRRFRMPEDLQERWGYPEITDEDKEKIFGLNAARLFKVDVEAQRNAIPSDYMSRYKQAYLERGILPENNYYGWVEERA